MRLRIARSIDGKILLCTEKMTFDKSFQEWGCFYGSFLVLPKEMFPEVAFENSPQEVELKLIGNGKK